MRAPRRRGPNYKDPDAPTGCLAALNHRCGHLCGIQVLTLSLKRFDYNVESGERTKIEDPCSFPLEHDFGAHTEDGKRAMYELRAVVIHRGAAHSGHYHAYIKDCASQGRWYDHAARLASQGVYRTVAAALDVCILSSRGWQGIAVKILQQ